MKKFLKGKNLKEKRKKKERRKKDGKKEEDIRIHFNQLSEFKPKRIEISFPFLFFFLKFRFTFQKFSSELNRFTSIPLGYFFLFSSISSSFTYIDYSGGIRIKICEEVWRFYIRPDRFLVAGWA